MINNLEGLPKAYPGPHTIISLPVVGIVLSLLGSIPFFLCFATLDPISSSSTYLVWLFAVMINGAIGDFYGKILGKDILAALWIDHPIEISWFIVSGALCGVCVGVMTGLAISFENALKYGESIFIMGAVIGSILGLIIGTIFGWITGATFKLILKRKYSRDKC
jgi:hypothetical protein